MHNTNFYIKFCHVWWNYISIYTNYNNQKQWIYVYYVEYNLNAINDMILKRENERREKLISIFQS